MKRILIALFLVLSLIICLPSCGEKIEENPDFATYNELFNKTFENYTIDVSVTGINGDVLNEQYVVTTEDGVRSVAYSIERLNQFEIEGDLINVPGNYVSVTTGEYSTEESKSQGFDVPKFNFSYKCLNDKEVAFANSYSTGVTSVKDFMGLDVNATNGQVKLEYKGEKVISISVSFLTEAKSTVVITYTFN